MNPLLFKSSSSWTDQAEELEAGASGALLEYRQPAFALAFEYSKNEELVSVSGGIHEKVRLSMVVPAYLEKAR